MLVCFGQEAFCQGDQSLEQKRYYELKGYFQGREIDHNRIIQDDTVFYVNTKLLVFPSWYECNIAGADYVIIRYPSFKKAGAAASSGPTPTEVPDAYEYTGLWYYNGKSIAIAKADFEKIEKTPIYNNGIMSGYKLVSGQLTLPFKLRPRLADKEFQITTDVTIGAYLGIRKRLSKKSDIFVTVPFSLGLSYINLNNNTTSAEASESSEDGRIVPGITWASGFMIQIERFNLGFLFGRDYASQVGNDWLYHDRTWYSFGIGYSFSNGN